MDYKRETKNYYDSVGDRFRNEKPDSQFIKRYISTEVDLFLHELPSGALILDLGSGPGSYAKFFRSSGLNPVCVDIAPAMVRACKRLGLISCVMEAEHLGLSNGFFDGVWSYACLLHLPKEKIPGVLDEVSRVLKPRGMFFVSVREGEGQGFRDSIGGEVLDRRFFAFYGKEEMKELLESYFDVLHSSKTAPDKEHVYLNYVCRKKEYYS